MELFLIFILSAAVIVSGLIVPWINRNRIQTLKREIEKLSGIVTILVSTKESQDPIKPQDQVQKKDIAPVAKPAIETERHQPLAVKTQPNSNYNIPTETPYTPPEKQTKQNLEQHFGARLPVWIGGIALALAGFYLVKYSIENNLLNPTVRVALGGALGLGLLYSANWVRQRPNFANGIRISQSLSGAGIAVLYVVSFASTRLYHLVPQFVGFAAMAAVTACALVLALRHGPPIALLGLAGGFLTPALLSQGGGDAFSLFVYLYFTASGLMIVVRKTQWWWLSIPTILACLLWVIVWLFSRYTPGDSIWLGLFLFAISTTIIIGSRKSYQDQIDQDSHNIFASTAILNYIGLAGSLLLMGIVAGKADFGYMEWALFGLLALGGIGLAFFDDKLYGFVPWISMSVNAVMLFYWHHSTNTEFTVILISFACVYMGSSYFLLWRAKLPLLWAGLLSTTALSYYLLAYYKLASKEFTDIPLFWGVTALLLAGLMVYTLIKVRTAYEQSNTQQILLSVFSVAASSLITLALFIELEREFLSVAFATEMCALAWINRRVDIKALRAIIAVVGIIFGLLLMPQILLMIQLTAYSLVEAKLRLQTSIPIVQWPIFQLGLPAVMFLLSAYLLRQQRDDRLVKNFEVAALMLVAVMGYYFTRNSFHTDQNVLFIKADFNERGVITNILFLYGLACLWCGRKLTRPAFSGSGAVLFAIALFRITYFDLLIHNPLWDTQKISGVILINTLLLPYGFPIIWGWIFAHELVALEKFQWARRVTGFLLLLGFVLLSLNVRYIFHGEYLNSGTTPNAEIYSYSAVWLLLGIGLLLAGIAKHHKALRYASLAIILLAVAKVFLYDASELEGLYRVFSFFGLGLSLIGLSYLYTRFLPADDPAS